jgi:hypothetical protein
MILEFGFMMAASAEIFWRVMALPAVMSTMAICCTPPTFSHTVMYLSDSIEHDPNLTFSPLTDNGGLTICQGGGVVNGTGKTSKQNR